MSVTLTFSCSGCGATAEGTRPMRKEYGWGTARWQESPDALAPKGWVAADPYTYCCYCPKCWAEIVAGHPAVNAAGPEERMQRFSRDNAPEDGWLIFRKRVTTRAIRIDGPFEVETSEGTLTCKDGWLCMDARGYPYPVANDEFELIYEKLP